MRILGLDPGSRITGFGVIELAGDRSRYVESGCIRAGDGALPERLGRIHEAVRSLMADYRPEEVAVEQVFVCRNVDSALKLGQARGAALCAVVASGLAVAEYTPARIKQAMVGKGNASKDQVQHMVRALLELPGTPQADAADALAVALCHAHSRWAAGHAPRVARGRR